MILAYIGAAIIVGLLIGLVTISVLWTMKVINRSIRDKSVELISVYDELFDQKSKELNQITQEINRQKEYMERLEKYSHYLGDGGVTGTENSAADYLRATELMTQTSYIESGISEIYGIVRGKFHFDVKSLVNKVPASVDERSKVIKSFIDKIPYEIVYRLSSLTPEDQKSILQDSIDDKEKNILEEYIGLYDEFDIIKFYDWLNALYQQKSGEKVLWTVSADQESYKELDCKVVPDGDICEGIMIEANGKLYDYSVRKREIG